MFVSAQMALIYIELFHLDALNLGSLISLSPFVVSETSMVDKKFKNFNRQPTGAKKEATLIPTVKRECMSVQEPSLSTH